MKILLIVMLAMSVSCGKSSRVAPRAANPEQALAIRWVEENEGDPEVEWISLEGPRPGNFGGQLIKAKYRAIGPLGGPVVQERVFLVRDGGLEYNVHFHWPEK